MSAAGNATGSFSSSQPDLGESDAQGAKPPTKGEMLAEIEDLFYTESRQGAKCSIGLVLAVLEPDVVEKLNEVMGKLEVPSSRIAELLQKWGHRVSIGTVQRHRRKGTAAGCRCK